MAHPCTRIVFRVEDEDARKLSEGFESFEAAHLKTLEKFHAIVRVERNDLDFSLKLRKPELPGPSEAEERRNAVIGASRAKYATPRAEVEAALLVGIKRDKTMPPPDEPPASPPPKLLAPVIVPPPEATELPKVTVSEKKIIEPPRDLGRGGAQHQAIQQRLKTAAEGLRFRSIIEKQILEGQGSVDLLLERDGQSIACEISISTTIDHEVGNVSKCLKAGFSEVAVICLDAERLRKIEAATSGSLGVEMAARVKFFQPDQFIAYLKERPMQPRKASDSTEMRRGYRVKRKTVPMSPEEEKAREDDAIRIVAESMRKKKT
jgi:hypothetical protein